MAATVLTIPGYNGSGPGHWQSHWERERADCRRVRQASWRDPDPVAWVAGIDAAVRSHAGPLVLVAHSLGCAAVVHWVAQAPESAGRVAALLVAPCDVERQGMPAPITRFAPLPVLSLPFRSILVASDDDPYASLARSRCLAERWGSALVEAGRLGHINADSALGSWDFGQVLLDSLLAPRIPSDAHYSRAAALRAQALAMFGTPCDGGLRESARP